MTTDPDCLFCKIIAGDIPSRRVYEDEHSIAFLDIAPFHRGHTLVVPRRHSVAVSDADGAFTEIAPAVEHVAQLVTERLAADGVNVFTSGGSVAGQEVFHLHVHVVPRYAATPGLRRLFDRSGDDSAEALDAVLADLTR